MQAANALESEPGHAICANCGAALSGPFCSQCGQKEEEIKRPVREFVEHALEAFFHFDIRELRSTALLLKPGEMTAQYLAGRRARFVPPVRLYILVSLFFFLAIWATDTAIVQFYDARAPENGTTTGASLGTRLLSPLDKNLSPGAAAAADKIHILEIDGKVPDWIAHVSAGLKRGAADPKLLNERLSELFPRAMVALVPIFGILSWLLYLGRGRYLIEHLIFALHFHTFAFVLTTALILIRPILPGGFAGWMFFLPAGLYLAVALRRVFGGSWFGTIWREIILLLLYDMVFTAGMAFLMGLSLNDL